MAKIYGKSSTAVFMDNEGKSIINYYKLKNRYVSRLKWPFLKKYYISKLRRLVVLTNDQKTRFAGFNGEQRILDELKNLNNNHHVFCGITIEGCEMDFVVIGPRGVFMIEAKNHGKMQMKYHARKSGAQCDMHGVVLHWFLRSHNLPCAVSDILVNKRKKFNQAEMPDRVVVLSPRTICKFIMRKPKLGSEDISKIVALLKMHV